MDDLHVGVDPPPRPARIRTLAAALVAALKAARNRVGASLLARIALGSADHGRLFAVRQVRGAHTRTGADDAVTLLAQPLRQRLELGGSTAAALDLQPYRHAVAVRLRRLHDQVVTLAGGRAEAAAVLDGSDAAAMPCHPHPAGERCVFLLARGEVPPPDSDAVSGGPDVGRRVEQGTEPLGAEVVAGVAGGPVAVHQLSLSRRVHHRQRCPVVLAV